MNVSLIAAALTTAFGTIGSLISVCSLNCVLPNKLTSSADVKRSLDPSTIASIKSNKGFAAVLSASMAVLTPGTSPLYSSSLIASLSGVKNSTKASRTYSPRPSVKSTVIVVPSSETIPATSTS
ncbi:hypothetical protein PQ477_11370 [Shouchella hunanensis]|uniref:Secreted protein n=1 Tax=Shouchella hunanensis TaxID=766894 RepID=A0ABY7W113_9BACI|nr:hypothetical protein [Shouchella hunanensis]WDF02124.1 hypothetical protein PQ477_11370 [Shouchella hunanensis]